MGTTNGEEPHDAVDATHGAGGCPLSCISDRAGTVLEKSYARLGLTVSKRPWLFLTFGWTVYLALIPGIFLANGDTMVLVLNLNTDFLDQFGHRGTRYYKQYVHGTEIFPDDRGAAVLYTPTKSGGVLTPEFLQECVAVESKILEDLRAKHDDKSYSFSDVCARPDPQIDGLHGCEVYSMLSLLVPDPAVLSNASALSPTQLGGQLVGNVPAQLRGTLRLLVGETSTPWPGASASDAELGAWISGAKALLTTIKLQDVDASRPFEESIAEFVDGHEGRHVRVNTILQVSLGLECARLTIHALPLIGATIVIMVMYASFFLGTQTRVKGASQFFLISCSPAIPGGAALASFGLMGYVGIDLNVLSILVPFLGLATGIDAVFLFVTAVKNADPDEKDVTKVISDACASAGSAITTTSLTSVMAFLVSGITTPSLPGIAGFCHGLVFTLSLNFFGFMVIFPAMQTLNERRIQDGRMDLMPCRKRRQVPDTDDVQSRCKCYGPGELRHFFAKVYAPLFESTLAFKLVGAILMLTTVTAGCILSTSLTAGMRDEGFGTDSSYLVEFFDELRESFNDESLREVFLLLEQPDLSNADYRDGLQSLVSDLSSRKEVGMVDCWLNDVAQSLRAGETDEQVKATVSAFIASDLGRRFARDARLSDSGELEAARCRVFAWTPNAPEDNQPVASALVDVADSARVSASLYHPAFAITVGRLEEIKGMTLETCAWALATVVIILGTCLPIPLAALAALNCLCVVVVVWGFMALADIPFSAISYTTIVMAIGFAVDYSCHVCHFSAHAPAGASLGQRMRLSVESCGYDVFHGCMTAFVGVVLLSAGGSSAFRQFSAIAMVVTAVGGTFALFTMPATVALFSRSSQKDIVQTVQG